MRASNARPYIIVGSAVNAVGATIGRPPLRELCEKHEVRCHWVKGHAENEYNNRCDALAVAHCHGGNCR